MRKALSMSFILSRSLDKRVEDALTDGFEFTPNEDKKKRIKRGCVHEYVAKRLKVKLNNKLCTMIKEKIMKLGGKPYVSTNTRYYRYVQERRHELV